MKGMKNKVQNGKKGKSSVSKINDETTAKLANVYGWKIDIYCKWNIGVKPCQKEVEASLWLVG